MSRVVSVALQARIDGYTGPIESAAKATEKLADAADAAGKKVDKSFHPGKLRPVAAEWEKLQDAAVNNKEAWNDVSGGLLKAGAAAGVAVGLVTREYATFDQAMSGVASTGADARQNIEALRETAKTLGADTAFSATEAANGVEELARAGVSASDILAGGLKGSLDLAAAGQIGVAQAAGIASTAMTQFKMSGDQIPHLADLLAAGAGKAMGGVDDLGAALQQSGLVASQFGLSIEETVGGLSAFASAGLLGSDAGTSLKAMLLALANPTGKTAKTMAELGIEAYDAQGKFVGLEGLAGQLQTRLGGLDQETRNAALAQIFGNDAIRAASILYEQGAAGIADWTAQVNDAGYASETAAELQNNLIGDLEKLGGAWSTLAIQMGESADGPLRIAVQALTGLLDIAAQFPVATSTVFGLVSAFAGLALTAGGIMKGIGAIAEFRTALGNLAGTSPGLEKVGGALGKISKVAGVGALAFAGYSVLVEAVNALSPKGPALEVTAAALERIRQGGAGLAELDSTFRSIGGGELIGGVDDVSSAIEHLADVSNNVNGSQVAYAMESFFTLGHGQAERLAGQIANVDSALSSLNMNDSTEIFSMWRDKAFEAGMSMDALVQQFPVYAAQVQSLAAANGLGELSSDQLAMAMAGTYGPLTEAQKAMGDTTTAAAAQAGAYDAAASAAAAEAEAQQQASEAARDALDAHRGLVDAINAVNDAQRAGANAIMSEEQAREDWLASLAAADEQLKKNGETTDENTEKGRANREYLRGLAVDARDVTDRMRDNGAGIDVLNAKMSEQREAFIQTAAKFGVVGAAAEQMANDYGLIPNYVETIITAPGAKVSAEEAAALNKQLEDIPEELRPGIIVVANTYGAERAQEEIDKVKSKSVTVTVNYHSTGQSIAATNAIWDRANGHATGGRIIGPGTPTSDDVPILASNGEFMVRTWAAQKIGYQRMEYMNRTGEIPRFRDGGQIGQNATSGALSYLPQIGNPGGSTTIHNTYQFEGREALQWLTDHLRDGQRRAYQERGIRG